MKPSVRLQFSDFWPGFDADSPRANPFHPLLSESFEIDTTSPPDFLLYSAFGHRFLRFNGTRIFYCGENLRPNFGDCDFAFAFDHSDDPRHFRLPLYKFYIGKDDLAHLRERATQAARIAALERSFCSFVVSSRANPLREEFFHLLSGYRPVRSGGRLLNNVGGRIEDKRAFLRDHRFNVCFENSSHSGYVTEKLFQAFCCDTIPIYWGHPDVVKDFNPAAFINCHEFPDLKAVVDHVRQVDQDAELYARYLREPIFAGGRWDGNDYTDDQILIERFRQIFAMPPRRRRGRARDLTRYVWQVLRHRVYKLKYGTWARHET